MPANCERTPVCASKHLREKKLNLLHNDYGSVKSYGSSHKKHKTLAKSLVNTNLQDGHYLLYKTPVNEV